MDWGHVLAFNLALIAALVSPGPAFLVAAKTTLTMGRGAGIAAGFGLGTMAILWTGAALLGLEAVFALFPWAFTALKTAGALYLIHFAIKTWRHAHDPLPQVQPGLAKRAFWSGFLVNLGNPKSVLFAAAVILVVFPQGLQPGFIPLVLLNQFALEILFYVLVATALSTAASRRRYLSFKSTLDRISATLLGAFGVRLLLEK